MARITLVIYPRLCCAVRGTRDRPAAHAAHGLPFIEKYPGLHNTQNGSLSATCTISCPFLQASQSCGVSLDVFGQRITFCLSVKLDVAGSNMPATRHFESTRFPSAIGKTLKTNLKSQCSSTVRLEISMTNLRPFLSNLIGKRAVLTSRTDPRKAFAITAWLIGSPRHSLITLSIAPATASTASLIAGAT